MSWATRWAEEAMHELTMRGLRRELTPRESAQGPLIRLEGELFTNFSSNDYLGLAADERLTSVLRESVLAQGWGAGASRLVVGDTGAHQSLEKRLAQFEGTEAALLFNSGYVANMGALSALCGEGDVIFSDALNHASMIDGCRLSKARTVVYPHVNVEAVEALFKKHPGRHRWLCTDSVFSMDGDRAPLKVLAALCREHEVALFVDEAHATGIFGERGAGLCEATGVQPDVLIGTLSKALGSVGAYAATSAPVRELLLHRARPLVFSTALPAAVCAVSEKAVELVQNGHALRERLWNHISYFARGLKSLGFKASASSAVFPVMFGDPERAMLASQKLMQRGVFVKAIRPPTVPHGTSRLRFALSAAHTTEHLDRALEALAPLAQHVSEDSTEHEST